MEPCFLEPSTEQLAYQKWACMGCKRPLPLIQSVDVTLQATPADPPLNFVFGWGIGLVHFDFLSEFGDEVIKNNLWLGKVYLASGKVLNNWATFRGKHRIIVRGTKNAKTRSCMVCGHVFYSAMGTRYICPPGPEDTELFESSLYGLVFHQRLLSQVSLIKWPHIAVDKLHLRDAPLDGLPANLAAD